MTTLDQDIRSALQQRALTATGFPADGSRAFEGMSFTPVAGEEWVRLTILPLANEAFVTGQTNTMTGILQIDLYWPVGAGTGAIEAATNNLKSVFRPATRLTLAGGEPLDIVNVERISGLPPEADFIRSTVQVRWRVHSARL